MVTEVTVSSRALRQSTSQLNQLAVQIGCDRDRQSFVRYQYASNPFRLSRSLRLDPADLRRVYLYLMNISPGLLAGDSLRLSIKLDANTQLYLTDQSATKAHTMTELGAIAKTTYSMEVEANSTLEYVPEPLILYADAALEQTIHVKLHPTARLFLSEIIVPGRLARGEAYQFRHYHSRLQATDLEGNLLFVDAMQLAGKTNPFRATPFFATLPVIATVMIVLPDLDLQALMKQLETLKTTHSAHLMAGCSPLPKGNGLFVRAMADQANPLKAYIRAALQLVRQVSGQPDLPEIPK